MAGWCLPKHIASKFLQDLKLGKINPDKLIGMTSKRRREFFKNLVGEENVANVNRVFESKLLLKNQQQGIITWAQQMAGLRPEAKRDLLSRVEKMKEVLNPKTEGAFLEEIVSFRLKTNVTLTEAKQISKLATDAIEKKTIMESGTRSKPSKGGSVTATEFEYGMARRKFQNYIDDLKIGGLRGELKAKFSTPGRAFSTTAGMMKSLKATFDNSWIGRQGWKIAFNHPRVWFRNSLKSFKDIWNTLRGKENVSDTVAAEAYARPNYDKYMRDKGIDGKPTKLAIGVVEEAFPESGFLERIPGFGRIHRAAQDAFTAMAYRNRMDIYDIMHDVMVKSGIKNPTNRGLGTLVNSLTSRGSLGKFEQAGNVINNVLFSGRKLRSDFDFLTAHLGSKKVDPFLKKKAAFNLVRTVTGTGAILTLSGIVAPGSVNLNPTSSDFGQIKIGDTRFDVTGGMRWLPILAARLTDVTIKNLTGERIFPEDGYIGGREGGIDVVTNFFENKLSPAMQILMDVLRGHPKFEKEALTFWRELEEAVVPLPIQNIWEGADNNQRANLALVIMLDALGISTNTYEKYKKTNKIPLN